MPEPEVSRHNVSLALKRFPGHAETLRRLIGESEAFRGICEDYQLARETLDQLAERGQEDARAKRIQEYQAIVTDLEREIAKTLTSAS